MLAVLVLAVVGLLIGSAIALYNSLVRSRARTREAWSGIDVQLRRRANLLPNLVEAVRGYAAHERATFADVSRARSALSHADGADESGRANTALSLATGRLLAVAERYPDLRASEHFTALQGELSDTEEKIAYARQFYNRNVLDYNARLEVFPGVLVARAFGFSAEEFFEADETTRAPMQIRLEPPGASSAPPPASVS